MPFLRYELVDTQARVHPRYTKDESGRRHILTGGLSYLPHPDVAFKIDVEQWWDGDGDRVTRLNLGFGITY